MNFPILISHIYHFIAFSFNCEPSVHVYKGQFRTNKDALRDNITAHNGTYACANKPSSVKVARARAHDKRDFNENNTGTRKWNLVKFNANLPFTFSSIRRCVGVW